MHVFRIGMVNHTNIFLNKHLQQSVFCYLKTKYVKQKTTIKYTSCAGRQNMLINNSEYLTVIETIKQNIHTARHAAVSYANYQLIKLYWDIGTLILAHSRWGNKFIETVSLDIRREFPGHTGYSVRNLKYMAKFAGEYPDPEFVQQVVAQIPWGHNIVLMEKVKNREQRTWYIRHCIENGWSRDVLVHQIELRLYERQVLTPKVANFESRLPGPQSEMALQSLKDPYIFNFIQPRENLLERNIELELTRNITKLLLELGTGFAFMGNQYHLEVGGEDFYVDLLFYNLNLRCYVVIELKTDEFKPEYAGKLNFYLSAVDGIMKKDSDNPSIGILLCKHKNNLIAEYALKDMTKPIGVSEYTITSTLPKDLENMLPSVDDIRSRIFQNSVENTHERGI